MGDAWDDIVAKSGLAPPKPAYGATNGANGHKPRTIGSFTANLSSPRVAGALSAALTAARTNIITASATGLGRNNQLNAEAANLMSGFALNGLISETDLHDFLYDVAREAGLEHDENCGPKQIEDTIRSGFKAGKHKYGRRDLSHLKDTVDVQFVDDLPGATDWQSVSPRPTSDWDAIFEAENGFWDARESLHHIYIASMSRMCAPWAVLANAAARALTIVRPSIVLPDLIGGKGSLNWFAAVAAKSGGGKGSASACGRDLIKHDVDIRNLGSGEGICQQFYKPGNKSTAPVEHEAIMFEATEIDAMTSLRERSGQTTMSVLRAGFSGEVLGFSYRNNDHHVEAHKYRMTLVLSLQPGRAGPLLEDSDGGTPQRFQWFPGADSRITADRPWWPGELTIPNRLTWQYPRALTVPKVVEETIITERVKAMQGMHDALDGHALFVREKFAFALAVLDNRTDMTEEDWELAGVAAEVSTRTRSWVQSELQVAEEVADERVGAVYGRRAASSDEAKVAAKQRKLHATATWLLKRLESGPASDRELWSAAGTRTQHRVWMAEAKEKLAADGMIECNKDGNRWRLK